jgi:hypothetical protein
VLGIAPILQGKEPAFNERLFRFLVVGATGGHDTLGLRIGIAEAKHRVPQTRGAAPVGGFSLAQHLFSRLGNGIIGPASVL